MLLFTLFIFSAFAFEKEGQIVCNLCKDTVNLLENLLTVDGAEKVKEYIDLLCNKSIGFLNTLCEKVLNFGVNELVKLIENHVDAEQICVSIHAC